MARKARGIAEFLGRNVPIHLIQLVTGILPNCSWAARIRGFLVGPFLGHCDGGFMLGVGTIINKPGNMTVGRNVYIAHYVYINALGGLYLHDSAVVGPMSVLATSDHTRKHGKVTHSAKSGRIEIGPGAWLASHVVATSGVRIGEGAVVGAGAVITKDIPDHVLATGVPAAVVHSLDKG